jgi:hypothetical protein
MDYQAGRAVGSLSRFMGIPRAILEQFAANVAASWRLRGYEKPKPNKSYEAYMNGVFDEEGSWHGTMISGNDAMENLLTDETNESDVDSDDATEVEGFEHTCSISMSDEQEMIDAQIQMELSSSEKWSRNTFEAATTLLPGNERASTEKKMPLREGSVIRPENWGLQSAEASGYAQPRSSSLFTFERPRIPGPPTDWEVRNSRDDSPAPTELSALDTFTTELMIKAEACSTIGSFSRGPSTNRAASEPILPRAEEEEGHDGNEGGWAEAAVQEEPVVVDLCSDADDEDDIEDLGLEIVGSRTIEVQG